MLWWKRFGTGEPADSPAAEKVMEALFDFYQLVGNHQPDDE